MFCYFPNKVKPNGELNFLLMVKDVYEKVISILRENKEYKDHQVFLLMAREVSSDPKAILNAWWGGELGFKYSGVERAVRKAREEFEELRDSGYIKRKGIKQEEVKEELKELSGFNYTKIKQGSLL